MAPTAAVKERERMDEKYIREYKHYATKHGANTCIFLQVGSFYELYDHLDPTTSEPQTSMKRAVEILGIQLKPKDYGADCKGYFAGFPDSQLHKFGGMLTRENWTVVIIDQVKDDRGRVVRHDATRILTPATHMEVATGDTSFLGAL